MFRTIRECLFIGVCLVGLGYYSSAGAADWPNWRGPNYNGISKETGWVAAWPQEGPKVLWRASVGTGFSSIAVSNGRVYAMGNINDRDILYCFEADTGKEIWRQSYPCPLFKKQHEGGPAATPTVHGDAVYTFSKNGDTIRFDVATGKVVWHRDITKELGVKHPTWYYAGSPFIVDDLVILNAGTSGIALNKADGSLRWKNGNGPPGYATAVPYTTESKKCVAIFGAKEIVGLVATTGKRLWRFPWKTPYDENIVDPIISGDTVFVSSGCGVGCALLKIEDGNVTKVWRNKNMRNHLNSSVLWQGYLYGFDENELKCLDFKTGHVRWSHKGLGKGSLMIADGKLIILGEKGKLVIAKASPGKFEELAAARVLTGKCWTVPVLANGRIYARNAKGQLVCVDVRGKG